MFELILIDFSWLYNRYYYVAKYQADLKGIPFEERTGWIKTTLLSMLTSFFKVVKEKCFTAKILLALDTPTSELVGSPSKEGYKQNRDKEEKHEVYENLNAVISALSEDGKLTFIRAWGYEADHVIAYLAEKYCDSKAILIYSGDKDLLQLTYHKRIKVSDKFEKGSFLVKTDCEIYNKFKNSKGEDFTRISEDKRDILKYRVLKGDPSDNLKPVFPRIKDKEIAEIIKNYWIDHEDFSSERAFKIIEDLKWDNPKLAEKLQESVDNWVRNYNLMNLHGIKDLQIKRIGKKVNA